MDVGEVSAGGELNAGDAQIDFGTLLQGKREEFVARQAGIE
jgi:hypothetical protein